MSDEQTRLLQEILEAIKAQTMLAEWRREELVAIQKAVSTRGKASLPVAFLAVIGGIATCLIIVLMISGVIQMSRFRSEIEARPAAAGQP